VKTIWITNGSAPHTICGIRSSASSGVVWMILPVTIAMTAMMTIQLMTRVIRNFVHAEILRSLNLFHLPQTFWTQNWL
jgi:hypothetical protein